MVAALVVGGAALFALGSPPGTFTGTVAPNEVPSVHVTTTPRHDARGTVSVEFMDTGDWETATLTVDWNASLSVREGDRRLESVGERVVLAEPEDAGMTVVEVSVTATRDGRAALVYRKSLTV